MIRSETLTCGGEVAGVEEGGGGRDEGWSGGAVGVIVIGLGVAVAEAGRMVEEVVVVMPVAVAVEAWVKGRGRVCECFEGE